MCHRKRKKRAEKSAQQGACTDVNPVYDNWRWRDQDYDHNYDSDPREGHQHQLEMAGGWVIKFSQSKAFGIAKKVNKLNAQYSTWIDCQWLIRAT